MQKSQTREVLVFWTVVLTMGAVFLSWATSRSYKANPEWVRSYVLASLPPNRLTDNDLVIERGKDADTLHFTAATVSRALKVDWGTLAAFTTKDRYSVVTKSSCEEYNWNCIVVLKRKTIRSIGLGYVM